MSRSNLMMVPQGEICQKQPPKVFSKKKFLKISQISQKNTCVGISGFQAYKFIKKRHQHRCFPVKFAKFLRAPILKNICERLLQTWPFLFTLWMKLFVLYLLSYLEVSACLAYEFFSLNFTPSSLPIYSICSECIRLVHCYI